MENINLYNKQLKVKNNADSKKNIEEIQENFAIKIESWGNINKIYGK